MTVFKFINLSQLLLIILHIHLLVCRISCAKIYAVSCTEIYIIKFSAYISLKMESTDMFCYSSFRYPECSLCITPSCMIYILVLRDFYPLYDQVKMASALQEFSKPSLIESEFWSLNDFPNEIILKILSYFGAEDLIHIISKVCERWNTLSKEVILWKNLSYSCYHSSDINRVAQVRYTTLLVFRTNYLTNFPIRCFKSENLNALFVN